MNRIVFMLLIINFALSSCSDHAEKADRLHNIRNLRYCMLVTFKEKNLRVHGAVYSSVGLDTCDPSHFEHFDLDAAKEKLGVSIAQLEGPYYTVVDTITLDPELSKAPIENFDGIRMQLRAQTEPYVWDVTQKAEYYKPDLLQRSAVYTYYANTMVYELIVPDGPTYIMLSYSHAVKPHLKLSDLATLGQQLTLPTGWQYRTRTLHRALMVKTGDDSRVIKDNFDNVYQEIKR